MLYVTPDKYEHLYGVLERRKWEVLENRQTHRQCVLHSSER
ncbi:MAG: hypothetical protein NRZ54_11550 [Staphylococcus haemolyticus]|nr:hypothetical protein NRZ53_08950 [Staphylococcus haemolyticus]WAI21540.1 MAG: hypothetical protein NRZ55_05870 [Staphylococcus haemolyticus]WAI22708.1 MAG: hypothetical protein NRZ54_11550 [Staphylococcus haemolyticus]